MNRKGFINIVIIVLIALAVGAAGYFAVITKNKKTTVNLSQNIATSTVANNATSSTIDISTWKTYRNEKYGFEMKYPKEWIFSPDSEDYNPRTLFHWTISPKYGADFRLVSDPNLKKVNNLSDLRFSEFKEEREHVNLSIGNEPGLQVLWNAGSDQGTEFYENIYFYTLGMAHRGFHFSFTIYQTGEDYYKWVEQAAAEINSIAEKELTTIQIQKVLSTFKFTK